MKRPSTNAFNRAQIRKQATAGTAPAKKLTVEKDEQGNYKVPDWETYRLLVSQTESIPELWSPESRANLRTVHHLMGIVSEIDELFDPVEGLAIPAENWDEEIGDLLWYLASLDNVAHDQGWPNQIVEDLGLLVTYYETDGQQAFHYRAIQKEQAELLDAAKRLLAYGDGSLKQSSLNSFITRAAALIAGCSTFLGLGFDLPELAKMNIAKLKRRYSAGFDATEAVNRKLEEEAKIFRQKSGEVEAVSVSSSSKPGAGSRGEKDCKSCNDPWGKGGGDASV